VTSADTVRVAQALAGDLGAQLPAMLEATRRLVEIDSGSDDVDGVRAVSDSLAEMLARHGFELSWASIAGRAPLLRAAVNEAGPRHVLVLGHADTVWPTGTAAQWPYRRVGDRITGPGVGDMKSSLVMACFALSTLLGRGWLDGVRVTFLVTPDEELGSVASRAEIERVAATADACVGLEAASPDGAIVVERGAVGAMVVRATGRSAHVTDEPPGASALAPLARLVERLEGLSEPERGIGVAAGVLRSGTARQVVPAEGELHLDLRAPDAASAECVESLVREEVGRHSAPGVTLLIEGGITRPPWTRSTRADRLIEVAQAAAAAVGERLAVRRERGGSDASFAGALGVPTLDGLGPVCHDSCSRRETVEVSTIASRGAIFGTVLACSTLPGVDREVPSS
jgi:glutamate carboxypeptidase